MFLIISVINCCHSSLEVSEQCMCNNIALSRDKICLLAEMDWKSCIASYCLYSVSMYSSCTARCVPLHYWCTSAPQPWTKANVFFTVSHFCVADMLSLLEADMRTIHPLMLGTSGVVNSQLCTLLEQLGVKRLAPRDVISHHIIPTLRNDNWKVELTVYVIVLTVINSAECNKTIALSFCLCCAFSFVLIFEL